MKAGKKQPKDYEEIRAKVARAAELIAGGLSEVKAAKDVGLPRSSLQQYMKHGVPKSNLPKARNCQEDLAGQKRNVPKLPAQNSLPPQRDEAGKFLPGNSAGSLIEKPTRKARVKFEAATPGVAEKLIRIFGSLPDDQPELILAFAKEILDRGLGKPKQVLDVKESREYTEYRYIQELILADPEAVRLAASLSERLESHSGDVCGEVIGQEVEALPPSS